MDNPPDAIGPHQHLPSPWREGLGEGKSTLPEMPKFACLPGKARHLPIIQAVNLGKHRAR